MSRISKHGTCSTVYPLIKPDIGLYFSPGIHFQQVVYKLQNLRGCLLAARNLLLHGRVLHQPGLHELPRIISSLCFQVFGKRFKNSNQLGVPEHHSPKPHSLRKVKEKTREGPGALLEFAFSPMSPRPFDSFKAPEGAS